MEILSSPENFGADPPTGSASQNFTTLTNLYDGTGDPCAEQKRLNGRAKDSSTIKLFRFPEIFWTDQPTGSAKLESFMVDLNDGTGDP